MKPINLLYVIAIAIFLSGCGDTTIDGSSEESAKQSLDDIRSDLSDEKKQEFNEAMSAIIFDDIGDLGGLFGAAMEPEQFIDDIKGKIDGMTASEIIERGNKIQKEQIEQEKKDIIEQIDDFEERIENAQNARQQASDDFTVTTSEYQIRDPDIGAVRGLIEVGIRNKTDKWVSAIRFESEVYSEEREVPWIEGNHRYEMSGGLAPGESDTWTLRPSGIEWNNPDAPESAKLDITVVNAEDENGDLFYEVNELNALEKNELENLKERFKNLTD